MPRPSRPEPDPPCDLAASEAFERLLAGAVGGHDFPADALLSAALVNSGNRFRRALVEVWNTDPPFRSWATGMVRQRLRGPSGAMASDLLWQIFERAIARTPPPPSRSRR